MASVAASRAAASPAMPPSSALRHEHGVTSHSLDTAAPTVRCSTNKPTVSSSSARSRRVGVEQRDLACSRAARQILAMDWPAAFALTCAVEVPIVVAMARRGRRRRAVADAFAANLLTHPLAWLLVGHGILPWLVVEVLVLLVEAIVYRTVTRFPPARAFAAAGRANLITASLSFVV